MKIEGIPDSINRADYLRLVESLGIEDVNNIRSLEFDALGVYATVYVRDDNGSLLIDNHGESVKNRVFIPVVG